MSSQDMTPESRIAPGDQTRSAVGTASSHHGHESAQDTAPSLTELTGLPAPRPCTTCGSEANFEVELVETDSKFVPHYHCECGNAIVPGDAEYPLITRQNW
jgi:hypothetical protein